MKLIHILSAGRLGVCTVQGREWGGGGVANQVHCPSYRAVRKLCVVTPHLHTLTTHPGSASPFPSYIKFLYDPSPQFVIIEIMF
jgi:hypothetical protein